MMLSDKQLDEYAKLCLPTGRRMGSDVVFPLRAAIRDLVAHARYCVEQETRMCGQSTDATTKLLDVTDDRDRLAKIVGMLTLKIELLREQLKAQGKP